MSGLRPAPSSPPGHVDHDWLGGVQPAGIAPRRQRESTDLVFAARRVPLPQGERLSIDSALERVKVHQTLTEIASLNLRSDSISSRDLLPSTADGTDASHDSEVSAIFSDWVQRSPMPVRASCSIAWTPVPAEPQCRRCASEWVTPPVPGQQTHAHTRCQQDMSVHHEGRGKQQLFQWLP